MYCMMSEWIPLKERSKMVTLIWAGKGRGEKYFLLKSLGHDQLLEICLLEKSARHDFIIARHRLSYNIYSCQLLDSRRKPVKL